MDRETHAFDQDVADSGPMSIVKDHRLPGTTHRREVRQMFSGIMQRVQLMGG